MSHAAGAFASRWKHITTNGPEGRVTYPSGPKLEVCPRMTGGGGKLLADGLSSPLQQHLSTTCPSRRALGKPS